MKRLKLSSFWSWRSGKRVDPKVSDFLFLKNLEATSKMLTKVN